mmetsp:Transcript_3964/g.10387  ORF Transcript_3964/g.10387 Transcript_3964/m.10387 type:complete len:102 (+) Transcript_3964:1774-2079(+)
MLANPPSDPPKSRQRFHGRSERARRKKKTTNISICVVFTKTSRERKIANSRSDPNFCRRIRSMGGVEYRDRWIESIPDFESGVMMMIRSIRVVVLVIKCIF